MRAPAPRLRAGLRRAWATARDARHSRAGGQPNLVAPPQDRGTVETVDTVGAMECTTFPPPQTTPAARTRILSILCSCHHVKNRKSRHPHAGRAARHPFKRMTGWLDERDLRGGQGRPTGNTDVLGSFQVHYVLDVLSISDVGFRVGSFRSEIQCPRGLIHASRPSCRPDIMLLCWPGLMSVSVCGITHFLLVK